MRRCGLCHKPGHNRRTCPEKDAVASGNAPVGLQGAAAVVPTLLADGAAQSSDAAPPAKKRKRTSKVNTRDDHVKQALREAKSGQKQYVDAWLKWQEECAAKEGPADSMDKRDARERAWRKRHWESDLPGGKKDLERVTLEYEQHAPRKFDETNVLDKMGSDIATATRDADDEGCGVDKGAADALASTSDGEEGANAGMLDAAGTMEEEDDEDDEGRAGDEDDDDDERGVEDGEDDDGDKEDSVAGSDQSYEVRLDAFVEDTGLG